jgi:hypothetical protein
MSSKKLKQETIARLQPNQNSTITEIQNTQERYCFNFRPLLSLSIFLSSQFSVGICDTDSELFCSLDDILADSGRDRVGNSGGVGAVVHHKHLQLGTIVDNDGFESVRVDVTGLLIRTVTDAGHGEGTLKTTTDTSINTLGFAPRSTADSHKQIRLMAGELLCALLDNSLLVDRSRARHDEYCRWFWERNTKW